MSDINIPHSFDTAKLGIFYLGGKIQRCNIEMHDVVFVIGKSLKEMSSKIHAKWCGIPSSLHIDSWFIVDNVDGFDVKAINNKNIKHRSSGFLYFVNLGYYHNNLFGEFHHMSLVVEESRGKAIEKAKLKVTKDCEMLHGDNIYNLDDCIKIDEIDNYQLILEYSGKQTNHIIKNGYQKISI